MAVGARIVVPIGAVAVATALEFADGEWFYLRKISNDSFSHGPARPHYAVELSLLDLIAAPVAAGVASFTLLQLAGALAGGGRETSLRRLAPFLRPGLIGVFLAFEIVWLIRYAPAYTRADFGDLLALSTLTFLGAGALAAAALVAGRRDASLLVPMALTAAFGLALREWRAGDDLINAISILVNLAGSTVVALITMRALRLDGARLRAMGLDLWAPADLAIAAPALAILGIVAFAAIDPSRVPAPGFLRVIGYVPPTTGLEWIFESLAHGLESWWYFGPAAGLVVARALIAISGRRAP